MYVIASVNLYLCFQDLNRILGRAQNLIAADNRLSNSPLMTVLRGDPQKILHLPTNCPTHHSAFWSPSPVLTVESFSQQINQSQAPLLTLFINKVSSLKTYKTIIQVLVSHYASCVYSFMLSLSMFPNYIPVCLCVYQVHYIRQLNHLPALAALLSDLMKVLPPGSETQTHTIASLLQCIPAGLSYLYSLGDSAWYIDGFLYICNGL